MENHIHKWEVRNKDYDGNIEAACHVDGCNETLSEDRINEILNAFQQSVQSDGDYCTCKPYPVEVIRDGVWLCSYCYRPRR